MSFYPGLVRHKELERRSTQSHSNESKSSSQARDTIAKAKAVDSPYFKTHGDNDDAAAHRAKAKALGDKFVREAQRSPPGPRSGNAPLSPPLRKRNGGLLSNSAFVPNTLLSFDGFDVTSSRPPVRPLQVLDQDATDPRDSDLLRVDNSKLLQGRSDDNLSILSEETRHSGSTSSRPRGSKCWYCKSPSLVFMPLTKCSTCSNRFHHSCGEPKPCDVKSGDDFICMLCISKERSKPAPSLPSAAGMKVVRQTLDDSSVHAEEATNAPPSLPTTVPDQSKLVETNSLPPENNNKARRLSDYAPVRGFVEQVYELPIQGTSNGPTKNHESTNGTSHSISNAPKAPAAMREHSSPTLTRAAPSPHKPIDRYRPDPSSVYANPRSSDMSRSTERPRWPPPVYARRERESFLRDAPAWEKDRYLLENRKSICKEITCLHWHSTGCRLGRECMYSHFDTQVYFATGTAPAKQWTCFHWLKNPSGCRLSERNCLYAHYDTGLYVNEQGQWSKKHITCFWWKETRCRKDAGACEFAHYETGILAPDPRLSRWNRSSFEIDDHAHQLPPSVRQDSESRRLPTSMSSSPPPVVRDTPLSPKEPTDSESEASYEPHLPKSRNSDIPEADNAEAPLYSRSRSNSDRQQSVNMAGVSKASECEQGGHQSLSDDEGIPATDVEDSKQGPSSAKAAHITSLSLNTVPRQFARRGGGRSRLSRTSTSDSRMRKPGLPQAEASDANKNKRSEREVRTPPSAPTAEATSQKGGLSHLCEGENCTQRIMSSVTYCKKCGDALKDRQWISQQPPEASTILGEADMTDLSHRPRDSSIDTSKSDHFSEVSPLIGAAPHSEMSPIFSRSLTEGSLTKPAGCGQKRVATGSPIEAMFLPSKKRKMDPPALLRAVTSASSVGTVPGPGTKTANTGIATAARLTLEDMTELEALRKEFDMTSENQPHNDMMTLKLLRARKEDKLVQMEIERVQAKAAERKAKLQAAEEQEEREAREKAAERKAKRQAAEEQEEREAREEAAKEAEFERRRKEREERSKKRQLLERMAQETEKGLNDVPFIQKLASRGSHTSPSKAPRLHAVPLMPHDQLRASDKRPFEFRKQQTPPKSNNSQSKSSTLSKSSAAPSEKDDTAAAANPGLTYTSPSEELVVNDEAADQTVRRQSGKGPKWVACEDCRQKRTKCRHYSRAANNIVGGEDQNESSISGELQTADPPKPNTDPVIQTLASQGATDPHLKELMNQVCTSKASSAQIKEFQSDLEEFKDVIKLNQTHSDINQSPFPQTESSADESDIGTELRYKSRIKACKTCRQNKRTCVHDPVTGKINATRFKQARNPELARKRVQKSLSRDSPESTAPHVPADDPMLTSLNAGIAATNIMSSAFGLGHDGATQQSSNMTHTSISKPGSVNVERQDAQLSGDNIEDHHSTNTDGVSYPNCGNCGDKTWMTNCYYRLQGRPRCRKCYSFHRKNGQERPVEPKIALHTSAELDGDKSSDLGAAEFSAVNLTPPAQQDSNGSHPQCANCKVANGKRLRRWKSKDSPRCDPCYDYLCNHGRDKPVESQTTSNADFELYQDEDSPDRRTDSSRAGSSLQIEQDDAPIRLKQQTRAGDKPKEARAAGIRAAKALILKAASTPAANSVAPDEIQALFCRPLQHFKDHARDESEMIEPRSQGDKADDNGPRLVRSRRLNEEEKVAAVARMRADGIEVDSADSDSEDGWSDGDIYEASTSLITPFSLVENLRYEQQPDPRLWMDTEEDYRSSKFDENVAKRKIAARPDRKANVKARQSGRAPGPGKLLAMSDWQARKRNYGSFHHETERNVGAPKKGTTIREKADRSKITLRAGFDDHDVLKEEVQVTPREFLGLPSVLAYDSIGPARLAAARPLAFRDATFGKTKRVPDSEKFPVGRGGG